MNNKMIIDYKSVAAFLASENDEIQADFFKVFIKELKQLCGTHYHTEFQLAGVNQKLSKEEKELLSMIGYEKEGGLNHE